MDICTSLKSKSLLFQLCQVPLSWCIIKKYHNFWSTHCHHQKLHTGSRLGEKLAYKHKLNISDSYRLLGVDADCTEEELRLAYLEKVKHYHPDRKAEGADASKFTHVQEAYKTVLDHRRGQAILEENESKNVDIHDIRHTVPQHRRYLTHDGIGWGSPSQRERHHKQHRVAQATESIYEHRKMKFGSEESSIVLKDKAHARKSKISNMIDRVVDDLVRESMQKGEFDNLPGRGKPLEHSDHNPLLDPTTHNLNKILVNNGYKPEWIMLSKEIRESFANAREKLAILREQLGPPPFSLENEQRWNHRDLKFRERVKEINAMIDNFNMIVPFMDKQMAHYNSERIIQKVLKEPKLYLPTDTEGRVLEVAQLGLVPDVKAEDIKIRWGEIWSHIKEVFMFR